jgi:1,4-alpha-glucan branching enzyme
VSKSPERALEEAIDRLLALRHRDPHSLLGLHPDNGGVVVRALRPEAERIDLIPDFGGRIPMRNRRGGIFEARIDGTDEPFGYLLEVTYPGGATFTVRDPYCFTPTIGEQDLYFAGEGRHERLWERLGAHPMHHASVGGTSFAVWAPTAAGVSVVGDFNGWDGRLNPMRAMGASGIWELFVPEVGVGCRYKFEIHPAGNGPPMLKADPLAFRTEPPPGTASVVHDLHQYRWGDEEWVTRRDAATPAKAAVSIYEVHLPSWRRVVAEDNRPYTYREVAPALAEYVERMGFTHVELLPIAEHPYGGSWGYQITSYYAPTARFGHPDDVRYLVDYLHQRGIGVLVDWVPAHFPRDAWALARFDGTALYEHADPRQGAHPDWGTLIFNYGRNEVRNFLIANALFWIEEYHLDGLRVDAVASMLYLDYSRGQGEWIPNRFGGRENEQAITFLRELNETVTRKHPGVSMIAEESTAWPLVSKPVAEGGLGFTLKWNMGWMHDTLRYFGKDPFFRSHTHRDMTFGMLYAFSEHFTLPLSHDEVVHGKGSLYGRMPGDPWKKHANLRAMYGWMWAYPGKKLLFMGGEFAQVNEWNHNASLDWHLLAQEPHRGVQTLLAKLNRAYRADPSLFEVDDEPKGFQWVQADSADVNVLAFFRRSRDGKRHLMCVGNFSPVPRHDYRVGCPEVGNYVEVVNTDAGEYGGSGVANEGPIKATAIAWDGQPASMVLTLPPLSVLWLAPE